MTATHSLSGRSNPSLSNSRRVRRHEKGYVEIRFNPSKRKIVSVTRLCGDISARTLQPFVSHGDFVLPLSLSDPTYLTYELYGDEEELRKKVEAAFHEFAAIPAHQIWFESWGRDHSGLAGSPRERSVS